MSVQWEVSTLERLLYELYRYIMSYIIKVSMHQI